MLVRLSIDSIYLYQKKALGSEGDLGSNISLDDLRRCL